MRVLITGAAGLIGTLLADDLAGRHDLVLLDRRRVPGRSVRLADLARTSVLTSRGWPRVFAGVGVVVHLAAASRPWMSRRRLLRDNIKGTWNVLQAAAEHRVPRFVFASSYWALCGEIEARAPACFRPDGPKIGSDAPARPTHLYGLTKAMGELAGRMLVDEERLRDFVAVRIGWCPADDRGESRQPDVRHCWIGHADIRSLLRRCVEADYRGAHVVYGVSGQPEAPFDLSATRRLLDWSPIESAPAPVEEPA